MDGAFTVPPGVTLEGAGPDDSVLRAMDVDIGVRMRTSAGATTRLRGVAVETVGTAIGVRSVGEAGAIELADVRVDVQTGVAIGALDLDGMTLTNVVLRGVVPDNSDLAASPDFIDVATVLPDPLPRPEDCTTAPRDLCTPPSVETVTLPDGSEVPQFCSACGVPSTVMSTVGLLASDIATTEIDGLDVRGFGSFGVALVGAESDRLEWSSGNVVGNLRVGIFVGGLDAELTDVAVERTYAGFGDPSLAIYLTGAEASLTTTDLVLRDNEGYGLFQAGASSAHRGAIAEGNGRAAFWIDQAASFRLESSTIGTSPSGNPQAAAGIVIVQTENVEIVDTTISDIALTRTVFQQALGSVDLGDGIHVRLSTNLSIEDVTIQSCGRVGMIVDLVDLDPASDVCDLGGLCVRGSTVTSEPGVPGALAVELGTASDDVIIGTTAIGNVADWEGEEGGVPNLERLGGAADDATAVLAFDVVGVIAPIQDVGPEVTDLVGVIAPIQ